MSDNPSSVRGEGCAIHSVNARTSVRESSRVRLNCSIGTALRPCRSTKSWRVRGSRETISSAPCANFLCVTRSGTNLVASHHGRATESPACHDCCRAPSPHPPTREAGADQSPGRRARASVYVVRLKGDFERMNRATACNRIWRWLNVQPRATGATQPLTTLEWHDNDRASACRSKRI